MPTAALGRRSGQTLPSLSLAPLTSYQTPHQPNPTRGWAHPGMLPAKPNQRWAPGHAASQTQPEGGHPGMLPAKPNQRWAPGHAASQTQPEGGHPGMLEAVCLC